MSNTLHPIMAAALKPFTTGIAPPPRGSVPLHDHYCTTGEGGAVVQCRWNFSSDGDIEDLEVWMGATDIFKALGEDQILALEEDCQAYARTRYQEDMSDSAIERYLSRQGDFA